jgi:tetratricopeptide (TPR) repeat protein
MSILYNRLKSVEKEKKPDVVLGEEEFPISGEIKRQREEQRRRTSLGIISGVIAFLLAISVGLGIMTLKRNKPPSKGKKRLTKPAAAKPSPPPPKKAPAVHPQKVVKQTESRSEKQPETPAKTPAEPVVLSGNLFEQGTELYKQRRYSEAASTYRKGLQQDPQQAVGYNNLGVVYYQQGKLKKAAVQLKIAVELNPQYAEAHYNLGVVQERLGQDRQALFHYLKFLEFASLEQQALQEMVQAHVRHYH